MTTAASRHEQIQASKSQVTQALESQKSSEPSQESPCLSAKQGHSETAEKELSFTEQLAKDKSQAKAESTENQANSTESEELETFEHDYKQLDSYTNGLAFSESGEKPSESEPMHSEQAEDLGENEQAQMTDEDAHLMAAFGMGSVSSALPMLFKAPVSMTPEQQESIAAKAAPLVKKYMGSGEPPAWLKRWWDEITFGMAIGGALFGCWQQSKAHKKELAAKAKAEGKNSGAPEQESVTNQEPMAA